MHIVSRLNKALSWVSVEALEQTRNELIATEGLVTCAARTELWDVEMVADPGDEGYVEPKGNDEAPND